jgi:ATP-binding cassette subfamily B protein
MDSVALKQQTFSQMVVFSSYSLQAFTAFAIILVVITALPQLIIFLKRVVEVIDTKVEITDGMASNGLNGKFGTIEFRNVSFKYPELRKML